MRGAKRLNRARCGVVSIGSLLSGSHVELSLFGCTASRADRHPFHIESGLQGDSLTVLTIASLLTIPSLLFAMFAIALGRKPLRV